MISWRTVTIRPRSRATRYDRVHAGYGYLQLHHQAPTGDTTRKIDSTRRIAECVRDDRRGVTIWRSKAGRPKLAALVEAYLESQRMVLVTNNLKHFSNVPGLTMEVWS